MTSPELILSNLPLIITAWSSATLAWGVYIGITYTLMLLWMEKKIGYVRKCDLPIVSLVHLTNLFLLSFLWYDCVFNFVGDSVLIVDLFYSIFLGTVSFQLLHWVRSKQSPYPS